jgi:hypothetical protein
MHVIAGKAVAFKEALSPEFKAYQQQVVKNADALAKALIERGLRIVQSGVEQRIVPENLERLRHVCGEVFAGDGEHVGDLDDGAAWQRDWDAVTAKRMSREAFLKKWDR